METEEQGAEETQTQEETQETSNQDSSESGQKTEEVEQKQPKLWQVVRGIQKDLDEIKKSSNKNPETKKVETKSEAKQEISPKDLYALMEAKVPQADIDEVIKASKLLDKSISETLQDGFVQSRLKDLAEQRTTAEAANTTGSKRTTIKVTDESLVEQAKQGKMPDPEALAAAEFNLKKKKP